MNSIVTEMKTKLEGINGRKTEAERVTWKSGGNHHHRTEQRKKK